MKTIDLNCDVGEGLHNEAELMPYISSCNIACGLHAGDEDTMRRVIELAMTHDVVIGAHPSFDDRENFGRKEWHPPSDELEKLVANQVQKLANICTEMGAALVHVKPHGALYNLAAKSDETSEAIISAITSVSPVLKLMGLAKSVTEQVARGKVTFIPEGFADRKYVHTHQLMARDDGGLLTDMRSIENQLTYLLDKRQIKTPDGLEELEVQSICLHGDTPGATEMIPRIHHLVKSLGYSIRPA